MDKIVNWIVLVVGVLLLLPLIGVSQLDTVSPWLIAVGVLVIGLLRLMKK